MKGGNTVKLAYINALPEESQFQEFIQTYTEECITFGAQAIVNWNDFQSEPRYLGL